ncbi:chondroitin AC/alginate lyase [Terfezia claveryi]|nr:chondroitin AC/alginate lyase [Terfezia claveryi]
MRFAHAVPLALAVCSAAFQFVHPGLLHTQTDFNRITTKVTANASPWVEGWHKLTNNPHSALTYTPRPAASVCRGNNAGCTQNYGLLFNDIAAAYALAIRWKVTGTAAYGTAAVKVLNAWAKTLKTVTGSSDRFLAAGLYGYQLANAAEIMRDFPGYQKSDLKAMQTLLRRVFYPMNHDFLVRHNDAAINHYWANWDLCNIASILSIGIFTDNTTMYNEALTYFKSGKGNGAINNAIWKVYNDGTAQVQESGRDQGHTTLVMGLLGVIAQTAYNQGTNLFSYGDNLILKASEYVAKYNLGYNVQYTTYANRDVRQTVISSAGRGSIRPIWELLYNHYVKVERASAPYTTQMNLFVRKQSGGAEGGGGNYGPNSGGYDQLGYGTLMYTR